jgi:transcriptional regulator
MHPNPIFRRTEAGRALDWALARGFGTLAVNGPSGPLLSHVPFMKTGEAIHLHLAIANPILAAATEPVTAVLSVLGPDAYVSPDWYGMEDQVPTWNHVAVHLRGSLRVMEAEAMRPMLDAQSAEFESRLPKKPWTSGKMSPGAMERMMRGIRPCELTVESIDSTVKLSQNKPEAARIGAAEGVEAAGKTAMAAIMRQGTL